MNELNGVIVPVATPLNEDYTLDEEGFTKLLSFLMDSGVHGIFANGSMGAFAVHRDRVQLRILEVAAEFVSGRLPVLAGVSETSSERVIEKITAAESVGVDYFVMLPPYHFVLSQKELLRFYRKVADHSPKPVVIYDNSRSVQNTLSVETIAELSRHPNIRGIKYSGTDVLQWQELLRCDLPRDKFALISGAGKLHDRALQLGFDGITEGLHNVIPDIAVALFEASRRGNWAQADLLQQKINRCFGLIDADGGWRGVELAFRYMGICKKITAHPYDIEIPKHKENEILAILASEGVQQPYQSQLVSHPASQ